MNGERSFRCRRHRRCRVSLIGLALWCAMTWGLSVHCSQESEGEQLELASVIRTLAQRQARVKSVKHVWASKKLYPKGSALIQDARSGRWLASSYPTEDQVVESTVTVIIDGQRIRHEREGQVWNTLQAKFVPQHERSVFANGKAQSFIPEINTSRITRQCDTLTVAQYVPVVCAYRLFDPVLGRADPQKTHFVGWVQHEGQRCAVIEYARDDGSERLWLSAEQGYSALQWQHLGPDGALRAQATMRYEEDDRIGWLLKSWEVALISNGKITEPTENVSLEMRVNEPIDDELFRMALPSGTLVVDRILNLEYEVGAEPTNEDALAGLLDGDVMEEFVERMREETGHAPPPAAGAPAGPVAQVSDARGGLPGWLWALIALVLAAGAGTILHRRKAAKS